MSYERMDFSANMKYGLIGEKLGHSYSKIIHEKLADYSYDLMPLSKDEFPIFMKGRDFTGINVTIPYKQAVIPYLDELSPLAREIGAVNTIVNKSGHLIGYNTDFYGFEYLLNHNDIQIKGEKCLILGNGGTSHTVRSVLKHLGAEEILVVSRAAAADKCPDTVSYEECYARHTDAAIIVNTTPLGMYPNMDASPIDLTAFTGCKAVADVIFNPLKTKLALQAEELSIKAVTGLEMLVAQAKQAIEYFLELQMDESLIDEMYKELLEMLS